MSEWSATIGWNTSYAPSASSPDRAKETAGAALGANLARSEQDLMSAYNMDVDKRAAEVLKGYEDGNVNPADRLSKDTLVRKFSGEQEAAIAQATQRFQRSQRMFNSFQQILEAGHQLMMKQIDKIRAQ